MILTIVSVGIGVGGCKSKSPDYIVWQRTDDMEFEITVNPMPPHVLEQALYTVVARDRKTREPIVGGEGRIFASSGKDGANTHDNLAPGKEPGTYTGRLFYVITGDWAIALQFRRDSTQKLERMDWMQNVRDSL